MRYIFHDFFNSLVEDLEDSLIRKASLRTQTVTEDFNWSWELPGVKKEEITVIHDGQNLKLSVSSDRKKLNEQWYLPPNQYNIENIQVKYQDGLLNITAPRLGSKKMEVRKIEIK